jgi:integrase
MVEADMLVFDFGPIPHNVIANVPFSSTHPAIAAAPPSKSLGRCRFAAAVGGGAQTGRCRWHIIAANPLTGVRLPKGSSRTRKALTAEQVEDLAALVDPWWRPFVLILAYCGLRPGEGVAL